MNVGELNDRFGVRDTAWFDRGTGGLTRLRLASGGCEAQLFLHGAHVTHFRPAGEREVLWMSARSWFRPDRPIRGGVPVCFPWFGAHPTEGSLPSHGFVRITEWTVEGIRRLSADQVETVLQLVEDGKTRAFWPHPFTLRLTVALSSRSLNLRLEAANTGAAAFRITEALHSYLSVADARSISIRGLEGARYVETAGGGRSERTQGQEPVTIKAETDRLYRDSSASTTIEDPGLARKIVIRKSGSATTVVWNPWIEKARRMEDFGDDEWPGMVCVETANAEGGGITLAPGAAHAMEASISVEH